MYVAAQLVRDARVAANLTQGELGRRLGITQPAIAQLEGPGANPTVAGLDEELRATGRRLVLFDAPLADDIDETLLAHNLRLTPVERLAAFETAHRELVELRSSMSDAD